LSRSANRAFDSFRDPALLVPLAGVLIYLAVLPLLMLRWGASRRKRATGILSIHLRIIKTLTPANTPIRHSKLGDFRV
jgi:hypothetical protein